MRTHLFKFVSSSVIGAFIISSFLTPMFAQAAAVANQQPVIYLVDPSVTSTAIAWFSLRGVNWGSFEDRKNPQVWLIDPDKTNDQIQLTVEGNMRECTSTVSACGGVLNTPDEMLLRVNIPDAIKKTLVVPKTYYVYVVTEKSLHALSYITLQPPPVIDLTNKTPAITLTPSHGCLGSTILIQGTGITSRYTFNLRFDGVIIKANRLISADANNTIDNVNFTVPFSIDMPGGVGKTVVAGSHKIKVTTDTGANSTVVEIPFIVDATCSIETPMLVKPTPPTTVTPPAVVIVPTTPVVEPDKNVEQIQPVQPTQPPVDQKQIEKDRKIEIPLTEQKQKLEQDRFNIQKEKVDLNQKLSDLKKQKQSKKKLLQLDKKIVAIDKKLTTIDKKSRLLKTNFCSSDLPIMFQSGCVTVDPKTTKNLYEGKTCRIDLPITLQPGCVGQLPLKQVKLSEGKPCRAELPLVWQEGCVQSSVLTIESPYKGLLCRTDLPITFQPGCVSANPSPALKTSVGKTCNSELPRIWQEGCVDSVAQEQSQKMVVPNSLSQPLGKCDPTIPHYAQLGCAE